MILRSDLASVRSASFDHFVILTPLTAETRNIVDAKMLAAMKPSAFLINLARGGIVDEDALIEALQGEAHRRRGDRCVRDRSRCRPIIPSGRWTT